MPSGSQGSHNRGRQGLAATLGRQPLRRPIAGAGSRYCVWGLQAMSDPPADSPSGGEPALKWLADALRGT